MQIWLSFNDFQKNAKEDLLFFCKRSRNNFFDAVTVALIELYLHSLS
jgi:hypothetical protein